MNPGAGDEAAVTVCTAQPLLGTRILCLPKQPNREQMYTIKNRIYYILLVPVMQDEADGDRLHSTAQRQRDMGHGRAGVAP
jgi:hypothetical protein